MMPLSMLWTEAAIVRDRVIEIMGTEAILIRAAVIDVVSGGNHLADTLEELRDE